jgi:hypothetical protein
VAEAFFSAAVSFEHGEQETNPFLDNISMSLLANLAEIFLFFLSHLVVLSLSLLLLFLRWLVTR